MHDDGIDAARDALNAAVDAVLAGAPTDAVAERLPPELRPLLAAGGDLAQHRPSGDAPRPGFVVGLGEQLRVDLRLSMSQRAAEAAPVGAAQHATPVEPRAAAFRPKDWWPIGLAGVLFGFFAGMVVRSGSAQPGEVLYPVKRGLEHIQVPAEPDAIGQVESRLDRAWRRLSELRRVLEAGQMSDASVLQLVDDLVTAYDDALAIAGSAERDGRALRRAQADADAAAIELERLADGRSSPVGAALVRAGHRLRLRVAAAPIVAPGETPESEPPSVLPGGDRPVLGVPFPTETPGQAPPSPAPSAPPERPTSEPTQTPVPGPTPTLVTPLPPTVPPTVTATPDLSALPTRTVMPPAPPPALETPLPPPTSTAEVPRPTTTRTMTAPTLTPVLIGPTATKTLLSPPTVTPPPRTATATRPPTQTPLPPPPASPTSGSDNPSPPTVSPHTATPFGEVPTPKPPPTDPANPTTTPQPQPSATVPDPGTRPGGGRQGRARTSDRQSVVTAAGGGRRPFP